MAPNSDDPPPEFESLPRKLSERIPALTYPVLTTPHLRSSQGVAPSRKMSLEDPK